MKFGRSHSRQEDRVKQKKRVSTEERANSGEHSGQVGEPGSGALEPVDQERQINEPQVLAIELRSVEETSAVLRRAMELADSDGDSGALISRDNEYRLGHVLGHESMLEIAEELEIPLEAVAGAIVESRLDFDGRPQSVGARLLDRLVGPSEIWARRSTEEEGPEAEKRLMEWLEQCHGLKPRVRQNGMVIARRRRDLVGKVGKTIREARGIGGLGKARQIEAIVIDFDSETRASVGLSVDVSDRRSGAATKGLVIAVGGTVFVSAVSLVTVPATLLALPVAAGAGLLTSRKIHRETVRSMRYAVEETIDGVASQADPPSVLGGFRKRG